MSDQSRFIPLETLFSQVPPLFWQNPEKKRIPQTYHPHKLAATESDTIRLYDINTFLCYTSPHTTDNHRSRVNQVRYAPQGQFYVSAGKDGTVKIWDTVTSRCVRQIEKAHGGSEVCFAATFLFF